MTESEQSFQRRVIETAHWHRWLVHHDRPVRLPSGKWGTPIQGDAGFPDLCLARGGVVLLVELKTDIWKLEPKQRVWAEAIGSQYRLWRPRDWDAILAELTYPGSNNVYSAL